MDARPKKKSVADTVADKLQRAISAGKYRPGDRLPSENQLCAQLGVSRVSVRAALARLQSLGLVESRQGEGTFVCRASGAAPLRQMVPFAALTKLDRVNVMEFRRIVEVESAALAADRADAAMVRSMFSACEAMASAETTADIAAWDMEFHRLVAEATRNEIIIKVFDVLRPTYQALLEGNVRQLGALGAAAHRRITEAIELRRPDKARQAMLGHLNDTALHMHDTPEEQP